MWEVTLCGKPADIIFFLDLKNTIKKISGNALCIITFEKSLICSIAVFNKNHLYKCKKAIFKTILKICKVEYLSKNLQILSADKNINSYLLGNLISIEIEDEIRYAMQISKLTKYVNIRSFVMFKLNNLIDVWQREVEYLNNILKVDKNNSYINFLKFLALNSKNKFDILFVDKIGQTMCLFDKKHRKMKSLNLDDDVGLIANLVLFSPKKIIINCINCLSSKVANLISYIFEDRVSVIL